MANAIANPPKSQYCVVVLRSAWSTFLKSKFANVPIWSPVMTASATIDTSRNAEPTAVNNTNLSAAYALLSEPHIEISRYIGMRTISKNAKNTKRSRERKTPRTPVSRISINTMYVLTCSVIEREAAMLRGNSRAVSTTMNSEIPSTASDHEIPNDSTRTTCSVNWNEASPTAKFHSTYDAATSGGMDTTSAIGRTSSGRLRGSSATIRAPTKGSAMRMLRIGIRIRLPQQGRR